MILAANLNRRPPPLPWTRGRIEGRPVAIAELPWGAKVVVEPTRATRTGKRIWYVTVTRPDGLPRRYITPLRRCVREIIAEELSIFGLLGGAV